MVSLTASGSAGLGISDHVNVRLNVTLAEQMRFSEALFRGTVAFQTTTEAVTFRTATSRILRAQPIVIERVRLSTSYAPAFSYGLTITEKLTLREQIKRRLYASITQSIQLSDGIKAKFMLRMTEAVRFSMAMAQAYAYRATVSERLTLSAYLDKRIVAAIDDTLAFTDDAHFLYQTRAIATSGLSFNASSSAQLHISIVEQDGMLFADEALTRMVFQGLIVEGLDFLLDVAEPGDSYTAWAMNARSGGVTEYGNWRFNSYGKFGFAYVGAADDGLYELIGDEDQETPIAALIQGGMVQLAGTHLAGLKAVYVAQRGDGEMYLRLTSSNMAVTYRVRARTMTSRRIDLGKGWRSRFITWELETLGHDFDLHGLTFVPLPSQRRVGGR